MTATLAAVLATLLAQPVLQQPPAAPATPPPHIEWQRSLADALAVQAATGLPLLIAVNTEGEVFNDRFAATTYHDPTFIEATRGYVCVIASPDRHNERDYDAFGRRIECPRFPGCTCSEHINIEPELHRRWFNDTRNAPRHIGVSKDGKVLFDRFLDQTMKTAIDAIAEHRRAPKASAADLPTDPAALLKRRDAAARRAIEATYHAADAAGRVALLAHAGKATNEPFDLLRMALRDDDDRVFDGAALALAKVATTEAVIDIEDALARTGDAAVTRALVARLQELRKTDTVAARLAGHFEEHALPPVAKPWSNAWRPAAFDADDRATIEAELDRCEASLRGKPGDEEARLALATAQAALADLLIRDGGRGIELWFDDARANARKIRGEALQAEANAVIAYATYARGDDFAASTKATVKALSTTDSNRQPDPWLAARLLETVLHETEGPVYADPAAAVKRSQRAEIDRMTAIMDLLIGRGAARGPALLGAITLLEFAGCRSEARRRLEHVVKTFPALPKAHERWRTRLLVDLGAEAMRKRYAVYVKEAADAPTAEWFAGYASLVAAEQHTRDERRDVAEAAYTDAIERFGKSAAGNQEFADSANHFVVLALAGRAHLRHGSGDSEAAVADLLQAAELRAASLDESDGLQRKPRAIAGRVARELTQAGKTELAARLAAIVQ